MSNDRLRDLSQLGIVRRLGVPRIPVLRRYAPGQPLLDGPALVGTVGAARCAEQVRGLLKDAGVAEAGEEGKVAAAVLDATGARTLDDLAAAREFLTPAVRRLAPSGRLLVLGPEPDPG